VPNSSEVAAEAFQILGEVDLADPQPSAFIKKFGSTVIRRLVTG